MNYRVSVDSPTDELLTLGQILSEVGDYASTILDREHLSLSRRCVTKLNKVVDELISRQCIHSAENLYDVPASEPVSSDLGSLSIDDLHCLYRRWPIRHNERRAKGRESMSFYYEGQIVKEIKSRKATNKGERLKIDYSVAMYSNELSNMSYLYSCPFQVNNDKVYPDRERIYTTGDLTALIRLYKNYRDVVEREILVEYVDYALDWLEKKRDAENDLELLTELAELRHREIIRVPEWVNKKLEVAVNLAIDSKTGQEDKLPLALLTLQMINGDNTLEQKAQRIINRCYKSAFESNEPIEQRIDNLNIAVTCSDYVTRFSVRKVAALWRELSSQVLSTESIPVPKQIFQLLDIANKCEEYTLIEAASKDRLRQMLDSMISSDSPEIFAYAKIAKLRF